MNQARGGLLSSVAATHRMCASANVTTQEQAFLQALDSVFTMRIEGSPAGDADSGRGARGGAGAQRWALD
jgi:hypothetical protein